jgi:hypothetical protein
MLMTVMQRRFRQRLSAAAPAVAFTTVSVSIRDVEYLRAIERENAHLTSAAQTNRATRMPRLPRPGEGMGEHVAHLCFVSFPVTRKDLFACLPGQEILHLDNVHVSLADGAQP